ncbi:MAG: outer membrane lipoprotein carrier protein LolA [Spirochaetes bacterium]|nr:outer membrane lipoprotein carrier protein LolA [Spirochaetota bacterium]
MKFLYKLIFVLAFTTFFNNFIYCADELLSAKELLEKISINYKTNIKDYEADFKWIQNDNNQEGKLYFKNSQRLRLNFTNPPNQVFCTNGYDFWLYLPTHNFVLKQTLMHKEKKHPDIESDIEKTNSKSEKVEKNKSSSKENNENQESVSSIIFDSVGFDKFLSDYAVEFHESKNLVDYKGYKVYQFKLIRWRSTRNGINVIYLTVEPSGIIRKIEGITAAYRKIIIEYENIKLNATLPDLLFNYEPPAHARTMDNFITNQGELR